MKQIHIKQTSKRAPRIKSTSRVTERIEPDRVAKALGAEAADASFSTKGSPLALFALRQEVARRLISTGGRPSLTGTTRRQKIPLRDEDWLRLQKLAKHIEDDEVQPTPGQIASILLRQALRTIDEGKLRSTVRRQQLRRVKQNA